MSLRSLGLWAAALFWLAFAQPVAAQSLSTLSLKDAAGATQSECVYSDGSRLYPCHLTFGWTGSAAKAWTVDSSGYGGVNVFSSVLPTGAATAAGQLSGLGAMAAVPTASTNGTALGTLPAGAKGARIYLGSSDTVTFTVATTAPSSAPASTFTISGAASGTGPNWDESLSGTAMIYITAKTGSPQFRWY